MRKRKEKEMGPYRVEVTKQWYVDKLDRASCLGSPADWFTEPDVLPSVPTCCKSCCFGTKL